MLSFLQQVDLRLLHSINSDWANPILDWFMPWLTDYSVWKWPMLVVAAALLIWGGYRERLLVVMTLVLVLMGEGVNGTIKHLVNRPRPFQHLQNIRHVDRSGIQISKPSPVDKGRSMPSSHAANNVAFAFLMSVIYGRWGRLVWIGALLVAYSRIYIGSHYPSDVVAGLLLALSYSKATVWAVERIWQNVGRRWLAASYGRHPHLLAGPCELTTIASAKREI
ncbi:MAG: phosphatase PAP2 family protein [Verrucomicrobia bacterium]|nr:phosphatase PAP2 family protein [Verrucomicrobiota bacterium]